MNKDFSLQEKFPFMAGCPKNPFTSTNWLREREELCAWLPRWSLKPQGIEIQRTERNIGARKRRNGVSRGVRSPKELQLLARGADWEEVRKELRVSQSCTNKSVRRPGRKRGAYLRPLWLRDSSHLRAGSGRRGDMFPSPTSDAGITPEFTNIFSCVCLKLTYSKIVHNIFRHM